MLNEYLRPTLVLQYLCSPLVSLFWHQIILKNILPPLCHPFMAHSSLKMFSPSLDLLLHFSQFAWPLSSPPRQLSWLSMWDDSRLFRHLRGSNTEGDGRTGRRTENQGRGREPRIRSQSTMMLRSAVLGVKSISRFIISLHTFKLRCALTHAATIEVLLFITCA